MGHNTLQPDPTWSLDGDPIENVDGMEVLGVHFSANLSSSSHLEERMTKCRRAYFSLGEIGMTNHRVTPDVKSHLWRTICSPTLSYGIECLNISPTELKRLESFQGTLVKNCIGIGKRSHSSSLLSAMQIPSVYDILKQRTMSLLYNICQVPGPASDLCLELACQYVRTGKCVPGTLIARVVGFGESPIHVMLQKVKMSPTFISDGIVDSIKSMLCHINFIKPHSAEKDLVRLLTKAF